MDISLLNPFAHAIPKSVEASIFHANAVCIAFNHSTTATALQPSSSHGVNGPPPDAEEEASSGSKTEVGAATSANAPPSSSVDHRPHSLFAGNYLAAGRLDGVVAIWDIETRCCLRWFDAHARQVTTVAWSPHGRYLASGSMDWNVIIWDLGLKTTPARLPRKRTIRFDGPVSEVRFSPVSSQLLLVVLESQAAYIVDLRTPKYKLEQVPLPEHVRPEDEAGSSNPVLNSAQEHVPSYPLPSSELPITSLPPATFSTAEYSPDGRYIFAGTSKGHLYVFDAQTGKSLGKHNATSPAGIRALSFDKTGAKLVINAHDRTVRTFFIEYNHNSLSNALGWPFQSEGAQNGTLKNGSTEDQMDVDLASKDNDEEFRPKSEEPAVVLLPVHKLTDLVNRTPWNGVGWSGDGGDYVYAGAAHKASHNIYIWDTQTGTLEKVLQGPKDPLVAIDWHPTRPIIASVCSTGAVHLWFSKSEEAWSAYAPQFEELEENIQYEEREEEFDLEDADELSRRKQDEEEALVDVLGSFLPKKLASVDSGANLYRLPKDAITNGQTVPILSPEDSAPSAHIKTEMTDSVGVSEPTSVEVPEEAAAPAETAAPAEAIDTADTTVKLENPDDIPAASELDSTSEGIKAKITNGHSDADSPTKVITSAPPESQAADNVEQRPDVNRQRAAFTWRWVRDRRKGADGLYDAFESDDDVDPHFVIPVQLEDGNSSSDGSDRSG
ncbi:chromatin binding protein [Tilletia horrida]|uniref:Chromatin binding protein n=1 Tax=Tilletia horrida TaxID=155126 RepID=A0AAN6JRQ7_9BASI|nr:chromatin binding protein [Tilletia horrida]KAK0552393.1 chromatin binding protein [Tilletia horrida]